MFQIRCELADLDSAVEISWFFNNDEVPTASTYIAPQNNSDYVPSRITPTMSQAE